MPVFAFWKFFGGWNCIKCDETILHIVCSSPAKTMHFRALVAVILRVLCKFTSYLQVTCKQCSYLYAVRSCPVNRTHICKLCAVMLQVSCVSVHYLQFTCKYYAFFVFFAVVLQIKYRNEPCLQLSCKRCAIVGERVSLWEQGGTQWFHCMLPCCCFARRVGGLCRFVFLARGVWDGAWKLFFWFLLYWGYLMCHIALPINHDERGERQCYDESNETK